jgi:hypothetical protein
VLSKTVKEAMYSFTVSITSPGFAIPGVDFPRLSVGDFPLQSNDESL